MLVTKVRYDARCDILLTRNSYRVTGAQARVDARKRSARIRARFREWAASVRRERAATARPPAESEGEDGQRASRKRALQPGSYSEARAYKQRATQEERCHNADYDPTGDDMGLQPTARK